MSEHTATPDAAPAHGVCSAWPTSVKRSVLLSNATEKLRAENRRLAAAVRLYFDGVIDRKELFARAL